MLYRIETPSGAIHESPGSADYTHMRCLYCGKELALLKRLTGGGEFCSDAHKQSYQEEYNRLALSRLLQAQKKGQQASVSPAQNAPPPAHVGVAVEEPAPDLRANDANRGPEAAPVVEETTGAAAVEESVSEAGLDTEGSLSEEPEPLETAGFLLESPALAVLPEETPYEEPWVDLAAGPAMSEWQLQNGAAFSLSAADLLSLNLRPQASAIEPHAAMPEVSPQTLSSAAPAPNLSAIANARKRATANRLPASGAIAIDTSPIEVASDADQSSVRAVGFETTVLFADSWLLELSPTGIDFPAHDSDVVVIVRSHHNGTALAEAKTEPEGLGDGSPRASLEALSRLHQELVEQEAARAEPVHKAPVEEVAAVPVEVIAPQPEVDKSPDVEPKTVEIASEQTNPPVETLNSPEEGSKPKYTTELFEIPIRTFPPAKPGLMGGSGLPTHTAPLLPHLKSLPLRPKVALAKGYAPPSNAAASEAKTPAPATTVARTQSPSKPSSGGKPAARLAQPKPPTPAAKPVQPAAAKAAEPASPKAVSGKAETAKPLAKPAPTQRSRQQEASGAKAPEVTPKTPTEGKGLASKPAPGSETTKPAADTTKPTPETSKPPAAADARKPAADQTDTDKDNVPSFGIGQPASVPWLGSLKVKLGIAIVLLIIACVYFLGWGGKSRQPASSAISTDGSGPSIIMGEGGWVEAWAGDPIGLHGGRQITIYRPSLKLSDYRLEFQGSIDAKSIGWVFRASDPENYYAMKLMTVSTGLPLKVALFKYLVANGKQTQVGRAPVDVPVQQDTVFDIRVDVRGPQFTTYIQGQQIDSWTDDQLKIGGAGFLNEREERGKVKSVSIRYLSGGK